MEIKNSLSTETPEMSVMSFLKIVTYYFTFKMITEVQFTELTLDLPLE